MRLPLRGIPRMGGKSFVLGVFRVRLVPNGLSRNRYAVSVGIKAGPTSVFRHAVKRKTLAFLAKLPYSGYDVLVSGLPELREIKKQELSAVIQTSLTPLSSYFHV